MHKPIETVKSLWVLLYIFIVNFNDIAGATSMKDKFKAHVYRDSNLRKDDFAFTWEGELDYILVNNKYIRITDWSNFEDALDNANVTNYYPVAFWKHESENNMFEIGQVNVVNKKPYTTIL